MSFDPDIDDDYLQLDGLEPLALGQGNLDPLTVNNCLRETLSQRDVRFLTSAGLGVQPGDLVLTLWAPELGSAKPSPGDRLTDAAGQSYTIQSSEFSPRTQRYRTICRQAVTA